MTRVSLKEAYDNKDVVAQIYAIRDTAQGASDTADEAKTTADTASAHVDTVAGQAEQSLTLANQASASAEESAQTVAGYDARLTAVEENYVKSTGESHQTIDGDVYVAGQIGAPEGEIAGSAIESNDNKTRFSNENGFEFVGAVGFDDPATVPTATSESDVKTAVNVEYVSKTDGTNNLVHTVGSETVNGSKTFQYPIKGVDHVVSVGSTSSSLGTYWFKALTLPASWATAFIGRILCYTDTQTLDAVLNQSAINVVKHSTTAVNMSACLALNSDGDREIWIQSGKAYTRIYLKIVGFYRYTAEKSFTDFTEHTDVSQADKPSTSAGYTAVYDEVVMS